MSQPSLLDGLPTLLPDVPGKVHGIVSLDPFTLQCDGCGRLDTYESLTGKPWRKANGLSEGSLVIILSHIRFKGRRVYPGDTDLYGHVEDHGRLCDACATERGLPTVQEAEDAWKRERTNYRTVDQWKRLHR